ncbi:MAG: hypothetical protein HQ541_18620, partial [Mariniphaga sp.]|nr:hypothetical protein [Mariniphaga sp.]
RANERLSDNYSIVQFRKIEGDDASCLNLNRISNPAVLGVDPENLQGRFSFVAKGDFKDGENPWTLLDEEPVDNVIPAIADQTVIQWGLGKKVGDTLFYQNETGDTIALQLIAGLAPSIFQGNIIISNKNFLKNYPSNSGSKIFLIDGEKENKQKISDELNLTFRDYGWEQVEAPQRLADFYSVTNTYLSIFLALGALALILGTLGLAIVLARSILDRKAEIALLTAIGFKNSKVQIILIWEYALLLLGGILIGFISAIIATLPSLLSVNTGVSINLMLIIVAIILLNGIAWIILITRMMLKKRELAISLKSE